MAVGYSVRQSNIGFSNLISTSGGRCHALVRHCIMNVIGRSGSRSKFSVLATRLAMHPELVLRGASIIYLVKATYFSAEYSEGWKTRNHPNSWRDSLSSNTWQAFCNPRGVENRCSLNFVAGSSVSPDDLLNPGSFVDAAKRRSSSAEYLHPYVSKL